MLTFVFQRNSGGSSERPVPAACVLAVDAARRRDRRCGRDTCIATSTTWHPGSVTRTWRRRASLDGLTHRWSQDGATCVSRDSRPEADLRDGWWGQPFLLLLSGGNMAADLLWRIYVS